MKCINCESKNVKNKKELLKTSHLDKSGNYIEVNCEVQFCEDCGEDWISNKENERIQEKINLERYELLSVDQIKAIRESLPIKTKGELAKFLCLNEKAFSKWENKKTGPNRAYDLLLRLVAHSESNFLFVKQLHSNHFKFNTNDYYFLKKVRVKSDHVGFYSENRSQHTKTRLNQGFITPKKPKTNKSPSVNLAADSYEPVEEAA